MKAQRAGLLVAFASPLLWIACGGGGGAASFASSPSTVTLPSIIDTFSNLPGAVQGRT